MGEIATRLEADGNLTSFVPGAFPGKQLKIFLGIDDGVMPEESDCPFLAMHPGAYSPADDRASRDVGIMLSLVISNSGITTTSNRSTMNGLSILEQLYRLVEIVLEQYCQDKYNLQVSFGSNQTEITLPFYRLSWSLTFQENN